MKTNKAKNLAFHSLSPISDKENHKTYCDALEWAIKNRETKDIKNIALTGDYGSGKSSILKTLVEREIEGLEFLKISLATFKEEKKEELLDRNIKEKNDAESDYIKNAEHKEENAPSENEQLRLIEISILQQIIYHEENEKIPHSRFKKIRSLQPKEIRHTTLLILGLVSSFYVFFKFDNLRNILQTPEPLDWFRYLILMSSLTGFLIILFYLLRKVISLFQKLSVIKLNFQNLEVQLSENINKSILNSHIDEILYFFEATKYNVVIIEDLDRFEQTEIFTKLREINLLINNSKSVGRRVVFIYAVRDEIFKEKDRTKFFDFIVPVIPVVNHSNSNAKLNEALANFKYEISNSLIQNVSFYLDDMRLLYNSVNEFHIYLQKFIGESDQGINFKEKLFAIIVYKNLYPEDFVALGKNKGVVFDYIKNKKKSWIIERKNELLEEKENLQNQIELSDNELLSTLSELRNVYLMEYIKESKGLIDFKIDNINYSPNEMSEEENFEKLLNANQVNYTAQQYNSIINKDFASNFRTIQQRINPEFTYLERKEFILNKEGSQREKLIDQLRNIEKGIREGNNAKIKTLLKNKSISVKTANKQEQLILLLLRNGYIAEDYLNYISYFYPGDITEEDRWFLMNVNNEIKSEFDYALNQVDNLIEEINESEFDKAYILNYQLLDGLLEKIKFANKRDFLLRFLSNKGDSYFYFIESYIERGINTEKFIYYLSRIWEDIWLFLEKKSSLSNEQKEFYYFLILNHSEIKDLERIEKHTEMKSFIENHSNFLEKIEDTERIKKLLELLNIKFKQINFKHAPKEIIEYIYLNENYAINPYMLELMIKHFGKFDKKLFDTQNYSAIKDSEANGLKKYVNENIAHYVNSVYCKIETNTEENLQGLVDLLNHSKMELDEAKKVIKQVDTLIQDISELSNSSDLTKTLLEDKKLEPNWKNIEFIYDDEGEFLDGLIEFLNDLEVAQKLSDIYYVPPKGDENNDFQEHFLSLDKIEDKQYSLYLKSFAQPNQTLSLSDLSKEKVSALIKFKKLIFNNENYFMLKDNFSSLHLLFAIENVEKFIKDFETYDVSQTELNHLLQNEDLKDSFKWRIINIFDSGKIIDNQKTLSLIGKLYIKYSEQNLTDETLESILLDSELDEFEKITLFNRNTSLFGKTFIFEFLDTLEGEFKKLNEKGPMPKFEKNQVLESFFHHLKSMEIIKNVIIRKKTIQVTTFRG